MLRRRNERPRHGTRFGRVERGGRRRARRARDAEGCERGAGSLSVTVKTPADNGDTITDETATCVSTNGGVSGSGTGTASPIVVGQLTAGASYTCIVTATNGRGSGLASKASKPIVA